MLLLYVQKFYATYLGMMWGLWTDEERLTGPQFESVTATDPSIMRGDCIIALGIGVVVV